MVVVMPMMPTTILYRQTVQYHSMMLENCAFLLRKSSFQTVIENILIGG